MQLQQSDVIFKVLRNHLPAIIPGVALARYSKTALITESSNDKALCS